MADISTITLPNGDIYNFKDSRYSLPDNAMSATSENAVQNKVIKTYVDDADANLQFQIDGLGEPFRLKDFTQTFTTALTIPSIMTDISNTSIPNVDITITGTEATDFAIAGMVKYELKDASGNRLNAVPVCTFSMSGQTVLRVRMMVAGPDSKSAKSISGAILLKHR